MHEFVTSGVRPARSRLSPSSRVGRPEERLPLIEPHPAAISSGASS